MITFFFLLPQRTYIFTFLLSSRLFMHPYELMAKVCHLCVEPQRLSDPNSDKVMIYFELNFFLLGLVALWLKSCEVGLLK